MPTKINTSVHTYLWTNTLNSYAHPLCAYLLDSFCQREIQAQSGRRWAVAFTTSSRCWVMVVTYVELRVSLLSSIPCPLLPCTDHWYASADAVLCKPTYVHISVHVHVQVYEHERSLKVIHVTTCTCCMYMPWI